MGDWSVFLAGALTGAILTCAAVYLAGEAGAASARRKIEREERARKEIQFWVENHVRAYHQPNATAKDCPCASPKKR